MNFKRPILYNLILILVLAVCVIGAGVGFTASWLTDSASATTTLTIGKAVAINLYTTNSGNATATSIGDLDAAPGDVVNFNAVYLKANQDTSTCYVRIKLSLADTNNLYSIANASILGVAESYYWVESGGYFYLANRSVLNLDSNNEMTNLVAVTYGANVSYKIQVKGVTVNTNAGNNASGTGTVTVLVQAIQAANHALANWNDAFPTT